MTSRRQWLSSVGVSSAASLLGATTGCGCEASRTRGRLLGAGHKLGHRFRDGRLGEARLEGPTLRTKVVIVGAGPSGLSAAWGLRRQRQEQFVVFDLEPFVGGTAACEEAGAAPHPWGAHYVPVPTADNPDLTALLDEMGVLESTDPPRAKEQFLVRAPEQRLFVQGGWQLGLFPFALAKQKDVQELRRFEQAVQHWVGYRDAEGKRAFTIPLRRSSRVQALLALDQISALTWLKQQGYGSQLLYWYLEYACRDDYGCRLKDTSAWALLFYFASRREPGSLESQPFVTWPEGNGAIVKHLQAPLGDRLKLGHLVMGLEPQTDGVLVEVYVPGRDVRRRYHAEHVIVAAPQFIGARLHPALRERAPGLSYAPWLVANIHLSGRPHSDGVDLAWDSSIYGSRSLGYVEANHQRFRDRGPTVWTYFYPLDEQPPAVERQRLLDATLGTWQRHILSDLEQAHPELEEYVEAIDVWRWGHAMVRPTPGTVWSRQLLEASRSMGRIHFAHTDLSGLALFEESQYHGLRAARAVSERG